MLVRFLYILILFIIGLACSAFIYGGSLKLADGILFVIAGILFRIWSKMK